MRDQVRTKTARCAVYTRKSTEEGLEQDFNSLHAQREACEAYITSQKHEGWRVLPATYDDGGYSGGSMDRPGLASLLADIETGSVDVVVVYKVDRLTRSLTDFAKIVEIFDRHGVSFVSITQSFNTTTSMGRLTLNVLLSFAQFEREVTSERIRDKIAASKKKGLWMGGWVPLGYDADGRTLRINEVEAGTVRRIYDLYCHHGTVREVKTAVDREGLATKSYLAKTGRVTGGSRFSRGHLYRILSNPLYVGAISHKGQVHDGQHKPIVSRETWDAVQAQLRSNGRNRQLRPRAREATLLAGLVVDEAGRSFVATHTVKNGKRYRYYFREGEGGSNSWRVPAHEMESLVTHELRALFSNQHRVSEFLTNFDLNPDQLRAALAAAHAFADDLAGSTSRKRSALLALIQRICLSEAELRINVRLTELAKDVSPDTAAMTFVIKAPAQFLSRSAGSTIVIPGPTNESATNPALLKAVARGYVWFLELASGQSASVVEIAKRERVTDRYVSCLIDLAFLSPELVAAWCQGRQLLDLSTKRLTLEIDLPLLWGDQVRALEASASNAKARAHRLDFGKCPPALRRGLQSA